MTENRTFAVIFFAAVGVEVISLVVLRAVGSNDEMQVLAALLCLVAGAFCVGFVRSDDDPRRSDSRRRHDR
jgi:drug/metabolite transporter (DMT)-like permease